MHECPHDCILHRAAGHDPARRRFLTRTLLATVGAFLSACGDGNIGGVTGADGGGNIAPPPSSGPLVITIADFPPLAVNGGIARVDGGSRTPIAVTRVNAGTYLAFSMICPHAGYRPIGIAAGGFRCPNHGAQFDAQGTWVGGQRTRDLNAYPVTLDAGAGTLTIG